MCVCVRLLSVKQLRPSLHFSSFFYSILSCELTLDRKMSPVIAFLFVYIFRLLTAPEMGKTMRVRRRGGGGRVQSSDEAEIERRHRRVGHTHIKHMEHGTHDTCFNHFPFSFLLFHIFSFFLFIVSVYSADTFRLRA